MSLPSEPGVASRARGKKKRADWPSFLARNNFYLGIKPEVSGDEAELLELESCAGPRPSLMMARESGINFVCQPLSLWNFCMAASVPVSQWPEASPER